MIIIFFSYKTASIANVPIKEKITIMSLRHTIQIFIALYIIQMICSMSIAECVGPDWKPNPPESYNKAYTARNYNDDAREIITIVHPYGQCAILNKVARFAIHVPQKQDGFIDFKQSFNYLANVELPKMPNSINIKNYAAHCFPVYHNLNNEDYISLANYIASFDTIVHFMSMADATIEQYINHFHNSRKEFHTAMLTQAHINEMNIALSKSTIPEPFPILEQEPFESDDTKPLEYYGQLFIPLITFAGVLLYQTFY